jgi:hypothetical protein
LRYCGGLARIGSPLQQAIAIYYFRETGARGTGRDRKTAIRKLREARMDANSAITHAGKY